MDKNIEFDNTANEKFDERAVVYAVRDNSNSVDVSGEKVGKIQSYKFRIMVRDKEDLTGELTREEVDTIYKLYSSEGANLTQRSVSREFPQYTFQEFKKILRAFGITKSSAPLAQHTIEERDIDELIDLTFQQKENNYLKKLEQDRAKITEVKLKELTKKYWDLKNSIATMQGVPADIDVSKRFDVTTPIYKSDSTIMVYLSDMHIGADVSDYSIYKNRFNMKVARERLLKIAMRTVELAQLTKSTNLVVCNLGDCLDGFNAETTRGGHKLPQNMNNKDQYKNYIQMMVEFFGTMSECGMFQNISFYSVDGGNHDGDVGYMANKSLEGCLAVLNPNINVRVFDKYIEHFTVGDNTFIMCHGKDAVNVFKNMPLVVNDKLENQINQYIDYNKLSGKIHFIKGDLHQTAVTYASKFRYKSVGSFFGSSEWIHVNFGNTPAACDFDIVTNSSVMETRLELND